MSRPVPTALNVIRGNPGKRKLPENEPQLEACAPRCPTHLSRGAKKQWKRVVQMLADAGIMTMPDADALGMYCEAMATWIDAQAHIRKEGMVIEGARGYPVVSPHMKIANEAFTQMKHLLVEFGMTPASRTRVSSVKKKEKKGDWSDL